MMSWRMVRQQATARRALGGVRGEDRPRLRLTIRQRSTGLFQKLNREVNIQPLLYAGVIGRTILGGDRDLISYACREYYAPRELETADHKARREKHLVQATALTVGPVRPVHLEFGPEDLQEMILECDVCLNLIAEDGDVGIGQHGSHVA